MKMIYFIPSVIWFEGTRECRSGDKQEKEKRKRAGEGEVTRY